MATNDEEWEIFRDHEVEICRQTDPNFLIVQLGAELRGEWSNIVDKTDYIQTLQEFQNSSKEVRRLSSQARVRQRAVERLEARFTKFTASSNIVRAYQDWEERLQLHVDGLRGLVEHIQNFQHEQDSPNAVGTPCGNERSREHTSNLLKTARARVSETQIQLAGCKSWLKERGVYQSGNSNPTQPEAEDEKGGGRGNTQREPAKDSAEARDGAAEAPQGVEGAAPGVGTGTGGDPPDEDDGEAANRPRGPMSKPDIDDSDDEGEKGDGIEETRADDNFSLNDESLAEGGQQNNEVLPDDDLMQELEEALNERKRQLAQQPEPSGHSVPALPDYEDSVGPKQPALLQGSRSQQVSQQPGADQEQSSGDISHAQRRSNQRQSPTLVAAGAPDNPDDGGSNDSSDDKGPPKDPPQRNSKRRNSGKDSPDANDSQDHGRKKHRKNGALKSPSEALHGLEAMIAERPEHVRNYYHRAKSPECNVRLDEFAIAKFVIRLYSVLEDHQWNSILPIEEYFNVDGTEREGEPMLTLRRREFDQEWLNFDSDMPANQRGLKSMYETLYARLVNADAWHVRPPQDAADDLEWFRLRVVEAEHPEMRRRWKDHEDRVRRREGSAAAEAARTSWEFIIDLVEKNGGNPTSPPPSEPSSTPMPLEPLANRDWLKKRARELRFGDVGIPGLWTFLSTLSTGGQGHAALWVKYDKSGKVLEKKVVKETYLREDLWDDEQFWLPSGNNGTPREYALGARLSSCQQAFNIIAASHFGLYPERHMYRLYMEYCRFGDLEDLIDNQKEFVDSCPQDQTGAPIPSALPTSFLWCVFEALASAVCLMEHGRLFQDQLPEGWDSIFHRDIKPRNVFLADADETIWKSIPVPRLGDFGCALESQPPNCLPPSSESIGVGTPGYRPPEGERYDPIQGIPFYEYSSASDIFVVGQTMLSLIYVRPNQDVTQGRFDDPNSLPSSATDFVKSIYPEPLLDLVYRCLSSQPGDRITAEALCVEIQKHVGTCPGLKGTPLKLQPDQLNGELLRCKPEPYGPWAKDVR